MENSFGNPPKTLPQCASAIAQQMIAERNRDFDIHLTGIHLANLDSEAVEKAQQQYDHLYKDCKPMVPRMVSTEDNAHIVCDQIRLDEHDKEDDTYQHPIQHYFQCNQIAINKIMWSTFQSGNIDKFFTFVKSIEESGAISYGRSKTFTEEELKLLLSPWLLVSHIEMIVKEVSSMHDLSGNANGFSSDLKEKHKKAFLWLHEHIPMDTNVDLKYEQGGWAEAKELTKNVCLLTCLQKVLQLKRDNMWILKMILKTNVRITTTDAVLYRLLSKESSLSIVKLIGKHIEESNAVSHGKHEEKKPSEHHCAIAITPVWCGNDKDKYMEHLHVCHDLLSKLQTQYKTKLLRAQVVENAVAQHNHNHDFVGGLKKDGFEYVCYVGSNHACTIVNLSTNQLHKIQSWQMELELPMIVESCPNRGWRQRIFQTYKKNPCSDLDQVPTCLYSFADQTYLQSADASMTIGDAREGFRCRVTPNLCVDEATCEELPTSTEYFEVVKLLETCKEVETETTPVITSSTVNVREESQPMREHEANNVHLTSSTGSVSSTGCPPADVVVMIGGKRVRLELDEGLQCVVKHVSSGQFVLLCSPMD